MSSASDPSVTRSKQALGAPPIRWGWWGAALAVSLAIWAGIARLLGWI